MKIRLAQVRVNEKGVSTVGTLLPRGKPMLEEGEGIFYILTKLSLVLMF
jgi:hypothetical protein